MLRRLDDGGFTLIELLLTTIIVGVVISAVGTGLYVGLRTTDVTSSRLAESHDAQLAAAWFVTDVQSSDSVNVSAPVLDPTCSGVTGTGLLTFKWTDQGTGTVKVASYVTQPTSGGECPGGSTCKQLVRHACQNGAVVGNDVVVAHLLDATTPAALACTPGSCTGTPRTVSLSLTPVNTTLYAPYTVVGSRRDTQ